MQKIRVSGAKIRLWLTIKPCPGEAPLCYIPVHEIHAVERVDEEAFGMKFVCYILSTG